MAEQQAYTAWHWRRTQEGIDLLAAGTLYCPRYVPPSLNAKAGTRLLFCLLPCRSN